MFSPIHKREFIFPFILFLFFIIAGTLPYVYGYSLDTPDNHFMGLTGRGALHGNGYLMFAKQSQQGYTFMENRMTPEPLPRTYLNLEWWTYGRVARWFHLSLMKVFHIHRAVADFLFIFGVYYLCGLCLSTVFQRRLATLLITFGSGLGWIPWTLINLTSCFPFLKNHLSPDLLSKLPQLPYELSRDIDGVNICGYLINKPHFILAGAFFALTFACLYHGAQTGKRRYFLLSGVCALVNTQIRAFSLPEIYGTFALFPLFLCYRKGYLDWRLIKNCILAGVCVLPSVPFYAYLAYTKALGISGWEIKAGTFSQYIMWYGLPILLLAFYIKGLRYFYRFEPSTLLLSIWLLLAFLVAQAYPYLKFGEETAFFAFSIVPCILAVKGPLQEACTYLERRFSFPKARYVVAVAVLLICSLSSIIVQTRMYTILSTRSHPYFVEDDTCRAFQWLAQNTQKNDVVFSGPGTCPYIPRFTDDRAFTGHDLLTCQKDEKNALIDRFLRNRGDDAFKMDLIHQYNVRYVLVSPREKFPNGFIPAEYPWLKPVFQQGQTVIYKCF